MQPMPDSLILEAVRLEILHQAMFVIFSKEKSGESELREYLIVSEVPLMLTFRDLEAGEAMQAIYGDPAFSVLLENRDHRWTIAVIYDKKETIFFQYHRNAELMPGSAVIRILAFQFLLAIMNYYFHAEDTEQKPSWFFGEWKHTMDEG